MKKGRRYCSDEITRWVTCLIIARGILGESHFKNFVSPGKIHVKINLNLEFMKSLESHFDHLVTNILPSLPNQAGIS